MYIANLIPYKCMKQLCNNIICNDMQNKQYKNNMHMQALQRLWIQDKWYTVSQYKHRRDKTGVHLSDKVYKMLRSKIEIHVHMQQPCKMAQYTIQITLCTTK